jgi:hypothetical protein
VEHIDISHVPARGLLQLHAAVLDEFKSRGIVRTRNNPVGGYTEWLVARVLGLELEPNSNRGFDAIDKQGTKYEMKSRRVTLENPRRSLSAFRNLEDESFDFLAAVIYDESYAIWMLYWCRMTSSANTQSTASTSMGISLSLKAVFCERNEFGRWLS